MKSRIDPAKHSKVLLVSPGGRLAYGLDRDRVAFPNLGLGYIAGQLTGLAVEVRYVQPRTGRELAEAAVEFKPDVAIIGGCPFYSSLIFEGWPTAEAASVVRDACPEVFLIACGNLATLVPDFFRNTAFDLVFRGEIEGAIVALLQSREHCAAAAAPAAGQAPACTAVYNVVDLNSLSWPDHELLFSTAATVVKQHRPLPGRYSQTLFGRGCTYKCSFCTAPSLYPSRMRFRSGLDLAAEITWLRSQHDVRRIIFWDDLFVANHPELDTVYQALDVGGVEWSCNTRPDFLTEESVRKMARCGCRQVLFGAEADSVAVLSEFADHKELFGKLVVTRSKLLRELGIEPIISIIIGFPDDTLTSIEARLEFAASLDFAIVNVKTLVPIPGTRLYERALANGQIAPCHAWRPAELDSPPYGYPTLCRSVDRATLKRLERDFERQHNVSA